MSTTKVALKIDVDTYRGTRDGVPAMLEDLARAKVKASFFFTLGPDRSGLAVLRVFRKPGFLKKMFRTNAAKMYGFKTMLYGTLLPSPMIARECEAVIRSVREAGHEVGLHAWDHVTWQDKLDRLSPERVRAELAAGMAEFERVFGARPRGFAAPAWFCTDDGFEALEALGFDYLSISRGSEKPYFPRIRGRRLATIEVPTTLPTLDEMLGVEGTTPENFNDRLLSRYRPGATEVLTVHAETEGLAYRGLFQDLLERHAAAGFEAVTVAEVARAALADGAPPERETRLGEIPGRAGRVVVAA
jgi:peptidoglycan/xylan/chitin deacetylase (PgdA/CDA1 family)